MQPIRDNVEFDYNSKVYPAQLVRYLDGSEERHHIIFSYNKVQVNEAFNGEDKDFYNVARENCRIIDLLGEEEYKTYSKYRDEIRRIQKNYIVLNDNVYKHFEKATNGGHVTHYSMILNMEDEQSIDGFPPNDFFERDKYDRQKTFRHLKSRVINYWNMHKVQPDQKYLEKELTEEYKKMKHWIKENLNQ